MFYFIPLYLFVLPSLALNHILIILHFYFYNETPCFKMYLSEVRPLYGTLFFLQQTFYSLNTGQHKEGNIM